MQTDGNVVLYKGSKHLWASNTNGDGKGPYELVMQSDDHLVVYDVNSKVIWYSGVYIGKDGYQWAKGAYAVIQDDGNFVVYDGNRKVMWDSKTYGGQKGDYGSGRRHKLN